jgi:hypothetical protein
MEAKSGRRLSDFSFFTLIQVYPFGITDPGNLSDNSLIQTEVGHPSLIR